MHACKFNKNKYEIVSKKMDVRQSKKKRKRRFHCADNPSLGDTLCIVKKKKMWIKNKRRRHILCAEGSKCVRYPVLFKKK